MADGFESSSGTRFLRSWSPTDLWRSGDAAKISPIVSVTGAFRRCSAIFDGSKRDPMGDWYRYAGSLDGGGNFWPSDRESCGVVVREDVGFGDVSKWTDFSLSFPLDLSATFPERRVASTSETPSFSTID